MYAAVILVNVTKKNILMHRNKSIIIGDTLVFTPMGYRCIKSLEVGDEVISLNTNADQPETKKIKAIQKNISDSIVTLSTNKGTIEVTPKSIFTLDDDTLMEAKDLLTGCSIKSLNGYLRLKYIGRSEVQKSIFNLEVEGENNFFISKQDALIQGIQEDLTMEQIEEALMDTVD